MSATEDLIKQLDSFDSGRREEALDALLAAGGADLRPAGRNVNMHLHSFFSYNAEGYSPSHLVWAARERGLGAAGLCDFDVLDGLEEFLAAGRRAALRVTVNLETRAYVKDFAAVDINSPGEPGVSYMMGAGFVRMPADGTTQAAGLEDLRRRARDRNLALIQRINPQVPDIALDYEKDVLPLTPAGVATERHIVRAYVGKAARVFHSPARTADFWARVLRKDFAVTLELLANVPAFEEAVRSRLAKRGGLGYEAPSPSTFPPVEDFIAWVTACDAIPMATWLDGTSGGESDPRAFLECLRSKGAAAVNIIPDRNWNVKDPQDRAVKQANLAGLVAAADALRMPINIGTEMNRQGLPFVDDLDGEALRPHRASFLRGAHIMVGHSLLLRYAGCPYTGARAEAEFADLTARNDAFERVGRLPPLTEAQARELEDMGPGKAYARLIGRKECA